MASVEGDVDATVAAVGRAKKGKNFGEDEEKQLCCSFLHISQDPKQGTGQKSANFWRRITEHYNANKPEGGGYRPARSLETKWSAIKHDVAKFVGIYGSVYKLKETGTSLEDVLFRALELYKLKSSKGVGFAYIHAWKILKDVPRWGETREEARRQAQVAAMKRPASNSCAAGLAEGDQQEPAEGDDCEVVEAEACRRLKRPGGNRAAKDEQRKEKIKESAMHRQAKATEEMADATRMKSQILADQSALALFSMPDSTLACPLAGEFLLLRKQEEIARIRRRLAEAPPIPSPICTAGSPTVDRGAASNLHRSPAASCDRSPTPPDRRCHRTSVVRNGSPTAPNSPASRSRISPTARSCRTPSATGGFSPPITGRFPTSPHRNAELLRPNSFRRTTTPNFATCAVQGDRVDSGSDEDDFGAVRINQGQSAVHLSGTPVGLQFTENPHTSQIQHQSPNSFMSGQYQHHENYNSPSGGDFHSYHGYSQPYGSPDLSHPNSQSQYSSFQSESEYVVPETQGECTNINLNA